jgi:hypothetical protein
MKGINLFSQTNEYRRIMYVSSNNGLVQREEPSTNSKRIGVLLFGQRIIIYEQGPIETINGITDYWYKSHTWNTPNSRVSTWCWVFGGYLSEELPLDAPVFFGRWDDINDNRWTYNFDPSGGYMKGIKNSDRIEQGKWSLNGNIITIIFADDDIENIILTEIDRNNIILVFPNNRSVVLKRTNDLY